VRYILHFLTLLFHRQVKHNHFLPPS